MTEWMGKKANKTNYNDDVVVAVVDDDNDDDDNYLKGFINWKNFSIWNHRQGYWHLFFCLVKKHKRPNTKLTNKQKRTIFFVYSL